MSATSQEAHQSGRTPRLDPSVAVVAVWLSVSLSLSVIQTPSDGEIAFACWEVGWESDGKAATAVVLAVAERFDSESRAATTGGRAEESREQQTVRRGRAIQKETSSDTHALLIQHECRWHSE